MVYPEPCTGLRSRISAAIYGWDWPLTFICPGFDCGSRHWQFKQEHLAVAQKTGIPKWVTLVSGNRGTKTCGLPLRWFHFDKHSHWAPVIRPRQGREDDHGFPGGSAAAVTEEVHLTSLEPIALKGNVEATRSLIRRFSWAVFARFPEVPVGPKRTITAVNGCEIHLNLAPSKSETRELCCVSPISQQKTNKT